MSPPDTNIEKQKKRHKPALIGIALILVFAAAIVLLNLGSAVDGEGPVIEEIVDEEATQSN